jgi:hypothetical protein
MFGSCRCVCISACRKDLSFIIIAALLALSLLPIWFSAALSFHLACDCHLPFCRICMPKTAGDCFCPCTFFTSAICVAVLFTEHHRCKLPILPALCLPPLA